MMNYFDEIHVRMEKYKTVHRRHPRAAAFKMICWNTFFLMVCPREKKPAINDAKKISLSVDKSKLNIAFLLNGAIGDYVILLNYIYKFRQKYNCPTLCIDIFYDKNRAAAVSFIDERLAEHHYFLEHDLLYAAGVPRKYDLFIDISRYPLITNRNIEKIMQHQPALLEYFLELEKFNMKDPRLLWLSPAFDGQSAMLGDISHVKRIQQGDVGGLLGIREEYEYPIPLRLDETQYLKSLGLYGREFILIVNGADAACHGKSNKLWNFQNYNAVLRGLKKNYPDILTVQTGTNPADYRFAPIDLDLVAKTTLEHTKVLLKHACLLIGNEGGMVHLRHALHGGPSVVLFGSTDEKFFGYSENINIRGNGCPHPCEWLYEDWQAKCIHKQKYACMKSITPDLVLQKVHEYMAEENATNAENCGEN